MPVPVTAPPVAYKRLRRSLARWRLPRYRTMALWLEEYAARAYIAHLWREVFDAEPPPGCSFDAEVAFVGRVHQELFPVDLDEMDAYLNSGGNPMHHGIMVEGQGVPWEVEGFHDVHCAEQAMVAVVVAAGAWQCEVADRWLDMSDILLDVMEWWADRGHDCEDDLLARLEWATDPERAVELLGHLDPPLDGLAVLYQCVAKSSGNPFLDLPCGGAQGEYLDWIWEHYWDPADVRTLARAYAQIRDDVVRLDRYYRWYSASPGAEQRVVEVLTGLEDGHDE